MIKKFLQWLFAKERDAVLAEVKELLESAKLSTKKEYVKYERMGTESNRFLFSIQPVIDSEAFVSWLNMHKDQCINLMQQSMAARDEKAVLLGMAQIMMIDSLFKDAEQFKGRYAASLESKQNEQV